MGSHKWLRYECALKVLSLNVTIYRGTYVPACYLIEFVNFVEKWEKTRLCV